MTLNVGALISAVSDATSVDESYLMEDATFCKLLKEYAQTMTMHDATERLAVYVNENY